MICPACDRENDNRRRYCGKCGHNFRPCCRRCAFANDGGDRFCGGCGANLIAAEGVALKKAAPAVAAPAQVAAPTQAHARAPLPPVRSDDTESAQTQPVAVVALRPAVAAQARVPSISPKSVPAQPAVAAKPAAKPVAVAAPEYPMPSADELAGLFASTIVPSNDKGSLPQVGVSQDDVDRLFGVTT